jgi:hypothetical protein
MKIGITLNMSQSFWSNGLNQNVKMMVDLFERLGHTVYYITNKKINKHQFNFKYKYFTIEELNKGGGPVLDIFITAGFEVYATTQKLIKKRNKKAKCITLHLGNKVMFDMKDIIFEKRDIGFQFNTSESLSEVTDAIWVSPHHYFGAEYVKVSYGCDNVHIAPFIWDPCFIQGKIADLKKKGKSPFFDPSKLKRVQMFESNTIINKHMLIPFCIAQKFERDFPNILEGVNVFCCEKLRHQIFFKVWMNRFEIVRRNNFVFFNDRWNSLDALSNFGGVVVSHHYDNDLNYAHLEALYMGLPLVHNSEHLADYGYFYPKFDVKMGSNQLYSAINNHEEVHHQYMADAREFIKKNHSPYNDDIMQAYQKMLEE